ETASLAVWHRRASARPRGKNGRTAVVRVQHDYIAGNGRPSGLAPGDVTLTKKGRNKSKTDAPLPAVEEVAPEAPLPPVESVPVTSRPDPVPRSALRSLMSRLLGRDGETEALPPPSDEDITPEIPVGPNEKVVEVRPIRPPYSFVRILFDEER